jgi:hypothetical protein
MIVISANSPTFVGSGGFALFARKIDFPCLAKIAENDCRDISPELELDLTAFTTHLLSLSDDWVEATLRGAGSVEAVKQLNWQMTIREDSIAAFFDEKSLFPPIKNQNSSPELKRSSPPSPSMQGKGLEVVTEPSPAVTAVTDESTAPKTDPDILTEF